jgi:hypothetical protein
MKMSQPVSLNWSRVVSRAKLVRFQVGPSQSPGRVLGEFRQGPGLVRSSFQGGPDQVSGKS